LAYCNRGDANYDKRDYASALSDYNDALHSDPNFAAAYNSLGRLCGYTGDYDKAIAEYNEAIRLSPNDARGYFNRGTAKDAKHDYDNAIADYTKAIELKPFYTDACLKRGIAYGSNDEYDQAVADFSNVIQHDPNEIRAFNDRGDLYSKKGDYKKAIADYSESIRLSPDDAVAYSHLARLWAVCPEARFRNGMGAVEYAMKARTLREGKNPSDFDTLAAACAEAGNFTDAIRYENHYLDSLPDKDEDASWRLNLYEQRKPYHEPPKKTDSSLVTSTLDQ